MSLVVLWNTDPFQAGNLISVRGIPSGEAFGTPTKSPQIVRAQGIVSGQAFGLTRIGAPPPLVARMEVQVSDFPVTDARAESFALWNVQVSSIVLYDVLVSSSL